jgi:hypothetical protein
VVRVAELRAHAEELAERERRHRAQRRVLTRFPPPPIACLAECRESRRLQHEP